MLHLHTAALVTMLPTLLLQWYSREPCAVLATASIGSEDSLLLPSPFEPSGLEQPFHRTDTPLTACSGND